MAALPPLYKKNKRGKIDSWEVRVVKEGAAYFVQTFSGQLDGTIKENNRRQIKGKAKRSDAEQASAEALSEWTKKKKLKGYHETIEGANAAVLIRPMLAQTFSYDKWKTFPVYTQPKLDGGRCIAHSEGKKVILESRTGIKFQHLNKIEADVARLLGDKGGDFYLDGELFSAELKFEEIMGSIKKTTKGDKITADERAIMDRVQYHVYDCFDTTNLTLTMKDRLALLAALFAAAGPLTHVVLVETQIAKNADEVRAAYGRSVDPKGLPSVERGSEGVIVRTLTGTYELDKRSKHLQKLKEFDDTEFEIIGFSESKKEPGIIIWRCKTETGGEFNVVQNGTKEFQRQLFEAATKAPGDYIGAMLTVMHFGYTDDGIPRMPKGKALRQMGV